MQMCLYIHKGRHSRFLINAILPVCTCIHSSKQAILVIILSKVLVAFERIGMP